MKNYRINQEKNEFWKSEMGCHFKKVALNSVSTIIEGLNMEWIKVDKFGECPQLPVLLYDEYEYIYVGSTCFDYYDAVYWFPIPKFPFPDTIITNDEWMKNIMKDNDER